MLVQLHVWTNTETTDMYRKLFWVDSWFANHHIVWTHDWNIMKILSKSGHIWNNSLNKLSCDEFGTTNDIREEVVLIEILMWMSTCVKFPWTLVNYFVYCFENELKLELKIFPILRSSKFVKTNGDLWPFIDRKMKEWWITILEITVMFCIGYSSGKSGLMNLFFCPEVLIQQRSTEFRIRRSPIYFGGGLLQRRTAPGRYGIEYGTGEGQWCGVITSSGGETAHWQ